MSIKQSRGALGYGPTRAQWVHLGGLLLLATASCGGTGGGADTFGNGSGGGGTGGSASDAGPGNDASGGTTINPEGGVTTACSSDDDCASSASAPWCDIATGVCVACNQDIPSHECSDGSTCCGTQCVDLQTSVDHCGGCGEACVLQNATG